jgi:hypothetical protein
VDTKHKVIAAGLLLALSCIEFILGYDRGQASTATELAALRATVTALRGEDGEGSCAVPADGRYVVCWMEGGALKRTLAEPKVLRHPRRSGRQP